jgi:hypothetical protein
MTIVYILMKAGCACFEVHPIFLVNINRLYFRTTKRWLVKNNKRIASEDEAGGETWQ